MHTDRHIAEQGFRTRGGDGDAGPGFGVAVFVGDGLSAVNEGVVMCHMWPSTSTVSTSGRTPLCRARDPS